MIVTSRRWFARSEYKILLNVYQTACISTTVIIRVLSSLSCFMLFVYLVCVITYQIGLFFVFTACFGDVHSSQPYRSFFNTPRRAIGYSICTF